LPHIASVHLLFLGAQASRLFPEGAKRLRPQS
jgi:hypothetical protein